MKKHNIKIGFTLVELMVFFLFISILIAASTPLITKRLKNVPTRTYHGKFLCYRDDAGVLHGDYYNAAGKKVKETISENGQTVTFDAPKHAIVYKVEMIGAGAGGYDYVNYKNEENPEHHSYFNKDQDAKFTGESVYKLKDSDIKRALQGHKNRIAARTGVGGYSGKIQYYYSNILQTITNRAEYCDESTGIRYYLYYKPDLTPPDDSMWKTAGEEDINTLKKITPQEEKFKEYLKDYYTTSWANYDAENLIDSAKNLYNRKLQYTVTPALREKLTKKAEALGLDGIYSYETLSMIYNTLTYTRNASRNAVITYTYVIDFNSAEAKRFSSPVQYIEYLMQNYKSGSSDKVATKMRSQDFKSGIYVEDGHRGKSYSNEDCIESRISEVTDEFPNINDMYYLDEDGNYQIKANHVDGAYRKTGYDTNKYTMTYDGTDASGYAALKTGDVYWTNRQKATGDKAFTIRVEEGGRILAQYLRGFNGDAKGMISSNGQIAKNKIDDYRDLMHGEDSPVGPLLIPYDGSDVGVQTSRDFAKETYIELESTVPTRTYYIGAKGDNGSLVTKSVINLGKQCTISIPPLQQSSAISDTTTDEQLKELQDSIQNTTLTCQAWRSPMIANSGIPKRNCQTADGSVVDCSSANAVFPEYNLYKQMSEEDWSMFNSNGYVKVPDKKLIAQQSAEKTNFGILGRLFTKTLDLSGYGKGGDGSGYVDFCTKVGGGIRIYTKNKQSSLFEDYYDIGFPSDSCSMSNNTKMKATRGKAGAVIISW